MASTVKRVFRPRAIQAYLNRKRQPEFPALVRPRGFALLWVALLLTTTGIALAIGADLPIVATGQALVLSGGGGADEPPTEILVLLPPQRLGQLAPNQKVVLDLSQQQPVLARTTRVEARLMNHEELLARWKGLATGDAIGGPAAVARARCLAPCDTTLPSGSLVPASVVLGKQSLLDRAMPQSRRKP